MRLAFVDFEATGIDPKEARIIEYAAMLWDTELKQPLAITTNLVDIAVEIPKEVTEITGITLEMISEFGVDSASVFRELAFLFGEASYVVAHNGLGYDKILLEAEQERSEFIPTEKPWIDTMFDLPIPAHIKDRKLTHLAAAHEFINPMPHRAIADVFTMQKIFSKYDLVEILKISATPMVTVRALVGFDKKELAKKRGYHWDGDKKIWTKRMREFYLKAEMRDAGFEVLVLA